jgi:CRP-like cAMP-binding protein
MANSAPHPPRSPSAVVSPSDYDGHLKSVTYGEGATIFKDTDRPARLFLIRSGRVRLLRDGAVVAILGAGDVLGDLYHREGSVMGFTALADHESELLVATPAVFQNRPDFALEFMAGYTNVTRSLLQRLGSNATKESPAKLAEILLQLADEHGNKCQHKGEIDLEGIAQQDLAQMIGATRSFVSTLINEMKRDGLLGNEGRVLCILNRRKLMQVARAGAQG